VATTAPIPAAQYLRMSTDHQRLSLESQANAIQRYAADHGFRVVQSYEDAGRSGLTLKHRHGLANLLQDVVSGNRAYNAILVYDVSRWGRFQDTDEAAHYEFICKNSGIPIHYCAETFENDGTPPSAIMKTLKRVMAGEYSRELSVRLRRAKQMLAQVGFWNGGPAPYGLRRRLVSFDGRLGKLLSIGDVKTSAAGRVVLVPGPAKEVARVRQIYRLAVGERQSAKSIAREFNRKRSKCSGRKWTYGQILSILRNPTYAGYSTWGRTTGILGVKRTKVPKERWTLKQGVIEALIDHETFDTAQQILKDRTNNKSNDQLLDGLRGLLLREGKLSQDLINFSRGVPGASTYRNRFGSLRHVYELLGYRVFENRETIWRTRRSHQRILDAFLRSIMKRLRGEISVIQGKRNGRRILCFRDGLRLSLLLCPCVVNPPAGPRWSVRVIRPEASYITVLCRCTLDNKAIKDSYVFPNIDRTGLFRLRENDRWLKNGRRLTELSKLRQIADALLRRVSESND